MSLQLPGVYNEFYTDSWHAAVGFLNSGLTSLTLEPPSFPFPGAPPPHPPEAGTDVVDLEDAKVTSVPAAEELVGVALSQDVSTQLLKEGAQLLWTLILLMSKSLASVCSLFSGSNSSECKVGRPISSGITASTPYVRENGVSPVEFRGVVLNVHSQRASFSMAAAYTLVNFVQQVLDQAWMYTKEQYVFRQVIQYWVHPSGAHIDLTYAILAFLCYAREVLDSHSYSPSEIWHHRGCQASQRCMVRESVPSRLEALRPCMRASYSASLFEAPKSSLTVYSKSSPSGDIRTIPKPEPLEFAVPSTYNTQPVTSWIRSATLMSCSPMGVLLFSGANSAMKSASTCPLMAVLGLYRASYAPS
uniref:Uncharacterized protein n=1 Tax=Fagus sylvatica TaxID=28930 RepID=A0A2N9EV78_FAGSY